MICEYCSAVDFASLVTAMQREEEIRVPHVQSWATLSLAVDNGCQLCALLQRTLIDAYKEEFDWTEAEVVSHHVAKDIEGETSLTISSQESGYGITYDRTYLPSDDADKQDYRATRFPDAIVIRPFLRVCQADERLPLFSRVTSTTIDFNLCLAWLAECCSKHIRCSAMADQELPTRLIDLGEPDGLQEPRLVITQGQYGKYIALSHCWGESNPPVTNSESFSAYLNCIPFSSLPRTFRDAITIVRKLGFRYLWIDCYCIIQGDQEDWQIECAKMHSTFENSILTIAGPGAGNTEAGILHPRAEMPLPPCTVQVHDLAGQSLGKIVIMLNNGGYTAGGYCSKYGRPWRKQHSKLNTRAWIVQERYLSPRILYFGTAQVYMECKTTNLFECSTSPPSIVMDPERYYRALIEFGQDAASDLATWHHIVRVYSNRRLTEESDKLPALSGLASRVYQSTKDTYLAGLWQSALFSGLHWKVQYHGNEQVEHVSARSAAYTAPSWSWAACDYPVIFHLDGLSSRPAIHDISADVSVVGLDPFGQVSGGRLTLTGRMKKTVLRRRPREKPMDYWMQNSRKVISDFYACIDELQDYDIASFCPDDVSTSYQGEHYEQEVWCLLLGFHTSIGDEQSDMISVYQESWTALALEPVKGVTEGIFRRVGLLASHNLAEESPLLLQILGKTPLDDPEEKTKLRNWWADIEDRTIEII